MTCRPGHVHAPKTTNGTSMIWTYLWASGWHRRGQGREPTPWSGAILSDCGMATLIWVNIQGGTYHIPQDWVLQSCISDDQVESVGARCRVKFELSLRGVQFKLVHILAVRLCDKHHFLASLLVVESDKCLDGITNATFHLMISKLPPGPNPWSSRLAALLSQWEFWGQPGLSEKAGGTATPPCL